MDDSDSVSQGLSGWGHDQDSSSEGRPVRGSGKRDRRSDSHPRSRMSSTSRSHAPMSSRQAKTWADAQEWSGAGRYAAVFGYQ